MQLARLLGVSVKAIQSCEQGWRRIPLHSERQLLLLLALNHSRAGKNSPCWLKKGCPVEKTENNCPAWEFGAGQLCWFINGTICEGVVRTSWQKKMQFCRKCEVFASILSISNSNHSRKRLRQDSRCEVTERT